MDNSPQAVANTTFRIVKKGYDPDEVRAYLQGMSGELATAKEHAASMESRARQAVAKAQELMSQRSATPERGSRIEDTETISRTLLLAQRTADTTLAEARAEAERARAAARAEAEAALNQARVDAARLVDSAKSDARRAGEAERLAVESEVQHLLARLEFLRDDVVQMERYADEQRQRLRVAANAIADLADQPVGGLGEHRPPVLSAAADMPPPMGAPVEATPPSLSVVPVDPWGDADPLEELEDESFHEAPTQALRVVPAHLAFDDEDEEPEDEPVGLFDDHEITAEVPIVPPPSPSHGGGMRIVIDEPDR